VEGRESAPHRGCGGNGMAISICIYICTYNQWPANPVERRDENPPPWWSARSQRERESAGASEREQPPRNGANGTATTSPIERGRVSRIEVLGPLHFSEARRSIPRHLRLGSSGETKVSTPAKTDQRQRKHNGKQTER